MVLQHFYFFFALLGLFKFQIGGMLLHLFLVFSYKVAGVASQKFLYAGYLHIVILLGNLRHARTVAFFYMYVQAGLEFSLGNGSGCQCQLAGAELVQ